MRRVTIPKPGGGERPLGIPAIRDRVVQTAVKLVIEPIFEADLEPNAYGYRPGRSATDAIRQVHGLLASGYTDVVDADLSKYFDTIPHTALMQCVARRIVDRQVLALIKMWLKVPVEERGSDGTRRMTGGKGSKHGTPRAPSGEVARGSPPGRRANYKRQARAGACLCGVISPLLANLYMNRFLKHWRLTERTAAYLAHVVSYADDFVILSRGHAAEALAWTHGVMARLGLTLNEAKTSLRDARHERFDFLGYTFGPHWRRRDGRAYPGASPSQKSVQRLKDKVRVLLVPGNAGTWPEVRDRLNRLLAGWSAYFSYGSRKAAYRAADYHVGERVRGFLGRRHKLKSRGTGLFSDRAVFGELGVHSLSRSMRPSMPWALP